MGHFSRTIALTIGLLLAMSAAVFAGDLSGTYNGTGDVTGSTLELQQAGSQLNGTLAGPQSGTLFGQVDASDHVQGYMDVGDIRYSFYADRTDTGIAITLYDNTGATETHTFDIAAANTPEPTKPEVAPAKYYVYDNGAQSGPFSLEQVIAKITAGEIGRDTQVWQPGQAAWQAAKDDPALAASLPPEPPKPVRYFVLENGEQVGPLTLEEAIVRIKDGKTSGTDLAWKDGLEAWAPASTFGEFEAALTPVPTPPPAPKTTEPTPAPEPTPPPAPAPETPPAPPAEPTTDTPPEEPTTPEAPPATTDTPPAAEQTTESSSSVGLPDGRNLVIVSNGNQQTVSGVDGGYELVVDGKKIDYINGKLTVDGVEQAVPEFKTNLEIRVKDGTVTVTGD